MTEPIIQVKDVTFAYNAETPNPITALRNVSLDIMPGDYLAIVGHNGSGKSTLAKHFNALLQPTEGDVFVKGLNTKQIDNTLAIRSTVGMVFQNPDNQIVATVVEEDVAFGPENLGVPPNELRERVDWALRLTSLTDVRKRAPHLLSGGQKQRVAIAGVLAMKTAVVVFDEATAYLDPVGRDDVLDVARDMNSRGLTVITITHFMHEVLDANRVIVMEGGQIVMQGTPQEIFCRIDELRELQLDVPQTTDLASRLSKRVPGIRGNLLTVEETAEAILGAARARKGAVT
ncbi:MAG: energy-coupling factor transporter ATPase [Chloroflexi bacterium]|nr:energy-coupling factor transporter ATPase [Chloroflexota bacterium]MCL5109080.1 energy-coupling factor transporter ATPase [Chloroflexota bacterium]